MLNTLRGTQWDLNAFVTKPPEANESSPCTEQETFSKEESCSLVECAGVRGVQNMYVRVG